MSLQIHYCKHCCTLDFSYGILCPVQPKQKKALCHTTLHLRTIGSFFTEKSAILKFAHVHGTCSMQQKSTANRRAGKEKEGNPHMAGKDVG